MKKILEYPICNSMNLTVTTRLVGNKLETL